MLRRLRLEREAREAAALQGSAPTPPLLIGSERDAAQAFGEESDLHVFVRSFFRKHRPSPVILTRLAPPDDER